jgi:2-haloacid dehalogenase
MTNDIKALTFDVFGTVVDWRSAIIREGKGLLPDADWPVLADEWRRLYRPTLARVVSGELPWATFDALEHQMLEQVLATHSISLAPEHMASLATVWRRLDPWPDVVTGLTRLKERYAICALSNGSMWQLLCLAKHGRVPWDAIISVELFHTYKPDPRVYLGAAELLQLEPSEVMMVAAHTYDLQAARSNGLRTAFVARPHEWGPGASAEQPAPGEFDHVATSFEDLAGQLGA